MKTDFLRETSAFLSCYPCARRHAEIFSDTPEKHALTHVPVTSEPFFEQQTPGKQYGIF